MRYSILLLIIAIALPCGAQPLIAPMVENPPEVADEDRLENATGKSILVFTPHPDDEHFSMAATLAMLVKHKNTIHVVIFTNDNRGSKDLEMTRERLAQIRRAEEEAASKVVGIPLENLHWLGYEDGEVRIFAASIF